MVLLAAFGVTVVAFIAILGIEGLSSTFPEQTTPGAPPPPAGSLTPTTEPTAVPFPIGGEIPFCTDEYLPVCGVNLRTYANRCVAEAQAKVTVRHAGPCRPDERGEELAPL